MKRRLIVLAAAAAGMLLLGSTAALAAAHQNKVVTLAKSQTINNDYFASGDTVEIAGQVNGDVYVAGGQITIDGRVAGDVLTAGGTITINGEVDGNVRSGGGQITINGQVAKNVTAGGGTIELAKGATIGGNIVAGGGNIQLAGETKGNAKLGGGTVSVTGPVGGNVEAGVGQLSIGSQAKIGGHLTYWSNQDATISSGASIGGPTVHNLPPKHEGSRLGRIGFWSHFYWFGMMLLLGGVVLLVLPNFTREVVATIEKRPLASIGIGLLGLIVTPIAIVLLAVTVIGIPLAVVVAVLYGLTMLFSLTWVVLVIGDWLAKALKFPNSAYIVLLVGALAYLLISLVPFLGSLVGGIGFLAGFGGLWIAKKELYGRLRKSRAL